jgi:hypothetical protein
MSVSVGQRANIQEAYDFFTFDKTQLQLNNL